MVREGSSATCSANERRDIDGLLGGDEARRDRGAGEVKKSEVEKREDLAHLEDAVEIDGADLGELEGLLEDAGDEIVVPGGPTVGADGEEETGSARAVGSS